MRVADRTQPMHLWETRNALQLFPEAVGYYLESNGLFCRLQEFFLGLGKGGGIIRIRVEAMYAFLPAKPLEDHLRHCTAFFELLL